MVPLPTRNFRPARHGAGRVGTTEEDEFARVPAFAADAEVFAGGVQTLVGTAREKPTAHVAAVVGHPIPQPERNGVTVTKLFHLRAHATTDEVRSAVDLVF